MRCLANDVLWLVCLLVALVWLMFVSWFGLVLFVALLGFVCLVLFASFCYSF